MSGVIHRSADYRVSSTPRSPGQVCQRRPQCATRYSSCNTTTTNRHHGRQETDKSSHRVTIPTEGGRTPPPDPCTWDSCVYSAVILFVMDSAMLMNVKQEINIYFNSQYHSYVIIINSMCYFLYFYIHSPKYKNNILIRLCLNCSRYCPLNIKLADFKPAEINGWA